MVRPCRTEPELEPPVPAIGTQGTSTAQNTLRPKTLVQCNASRKMHRPRKQKRQRRIARWQQPNKETTKKNAGRTGVRRTTNVISSENKVGHYDLASRNTSTTTQPQHRVETESMLHKTLRPGRHQTTIPERSRNNSKKDKELLGLGMTLRT